MVARPRRKSEGVPGRYIEDEPTMVFANMSPLPSVPVILLADGVAIRNRSFGYSFHRRA